MTGWAGGGEAIQPRDWGTEALKLQFWAFSEAILDAFKQRDLEMENNWKDVVPPPPNPENVVYKVQFK